MATPFLAQILGFAGNFSPRGYAKCDGQFLSIAQNEALFTLLGTTYGGNGQTTFCLPDLRGRAAVHDGQGPGLDSFVIGQSGGEEDVTLTLPQLPAHRHTVAAATSGKPRVSPQGNVPAPDPGAAAAGFSDAAADNAMDAAMAGTQGGGQPHNNLSPYLVINHIIALEGVYPAWN